jgi:hypothetical protein
MSDYATLTDTVTEDTITFMMNPNWAPTIEEVGGKWYPFGYGYATISTDGTKGVSGTLTIVTTSDEMEATTKTILQSVNVKELVMPNGVTYYISFDPTSPRKGAQPFSLMVTPTPINTWTVDYVEVAAP